MLDYQKCKLIRNYEIENLRLACNLATLFSFLRLILQWEKTVEENKIYSVNSSKNSNINQSGSKNKVKTAHGIANALVHQAKLRAEGLIQQAKLEANKLVINAEKLSLIHI